MISPLILLALVFTVLNLQGCVGVGIHSVTCYGWDDLDIKEQEAIRSTCFEILQKLSIGSNAEVWDGSHPILRESLTYDEFIESMNNIQPRLKEIDQIELVDVRIIKPAEEKIGQSQGQVYKMICGSVDTDSPMHLRVSVIPGISKIVIAMVKIPTAPIERTATLYLGEDNAHLKLINMTISPSEYYQKDSLYFKQIGDDWVETGNGLSGYIAYLMAISLCNLGQSVESGFGIELKSDFSALTSDQDVRTELETWDVDGVEYKIITVGLIEALYDISPTVSYLSQYELGEEFTPIEASRLMQCLRDEHPELGDEFDGVLFQAYSQMPSDPTKTYKFYRVPLKFKSE